MREGGQMGEKRREEERRGKKGKGGRKGKGRGGWNRES